MEKQGMILIALALLILLGGCMVSKKRYLALEGTLQETQQSVRACEQELMSREGQLKGVKGLLEICNKEREACLKDGERCMELNATLEKGRAELAREAESLRKELERGKETIQDQKRIIMQLDSTKEKIEASLKEELSAQAVRIEEMEGKLKVTFIDKILFDTGSVQINPRGKKAMLDIAASLKEDRNQVIVVEGHTDKVPIGAALRSIYPTNWELSTARAAAVVRFLQDEGGLEPERLSATGYSYYRPLASNETEEGRRENRRIEIILLPQDALDKEPD